MSHFTTVETKIKNLVILQRVIEKLGYKLKQSVTHVRGYRQELTEADLVIDTKSSIDIGIKKTGDTYSFISDWENLETHAGIEQKDFLKQIIKAYAYENVMAEIKKKGYSVANESQDEKQHVHITIRKMELETPMADKHEIEIDIDDNGNVSFQVKGVKGKKCLEITKELEEALGLVVNREKTAEFYQTDTTKTTQIGQQGS